MKKTLLLITSVLFITAAAFSQSKVNINNLSDYGGKMFKENDDKPYTGLVFDLYRTTGNKSLEGRYKDGLRNGKWTYWYEDGQKYQETYENGILVQSSYLNKDGSEKEPINYKTTLIERDNVFYTKDTNKPYLGPVFSLNDAGKKIDLGTLKDGKRDRLWAYSYHKDFEYVYVLNFMNGLIIGDPTAIDELGNKFVFESSLLDNGGIKYEKYNNKPYTGPIIEEYMRGPFGPDIQKWSTGDIKLIGYYKNGLKDGNWEFRFNAHTTHTTHTNEIMMKANYKEGKAIHSEIFTDPDSDISLKFDLTKTSNKTKGFTKTNSNEIMIDNSWVRIKVYAQQFSWNIHYPGADGYFGSTNPHLIDEVENPIGLDRSDEFAKDDIFTVNQLHIPTNTNVLLEITTKLELDAGTGELNHTLLIPELNLLQESRPGVWKNMMISADSTGIGTLRCVSYCGFGAWRHLGFLTVHNENEYQAWLDEEAEYLEELGEEDYDEDDWKNEEWE